jgi:transcriptional regulator with XRE-family HTH domain
MHGVALSEIVKGYLRQSGYSQKELADALALNPGVLSRKLNGKGKAYVTHQELHRLVTQLVDWRAIATQEEVLRLLRAANVEPAIFSHDDWETPPLSTLERKHTGPLPTNDPLHAARVPQHNLPTPTTRLIGRDWAVERLRKLLGSDDVRLVTLVGSGGSGKTRLAQHVAGGMIDAFAQGVWFVSLAGQRDPTLVPISIMQALHIQSAPGSSPLESLISYLKDRQLLLLLDNFEQVGEAAADVDVLLAEVPGLKILVTSRAILRLSGEHKFSVPPLDVPDPFRVSEPGALVLYGAEQLFVVRAQSIDPDNGVHFGGARLPNYVGASRSCSFCARRSEAIMKGLPTRR